MTVPKPGSGFSEFPRTPPHLSEAQVKKKFEKVFSWLEMTPEFRQRVREFDRIALQNRISKLGSFGEEPDSHSKKEKIKSTDSYFNVAKVLCASCLGVFSLREGFAKSHEAALHAEELSSVFRELASLHGLAGCEEDKREVQTFLEQNYEYTPSYLKALCDVSSLKEFFQLYFALPSEVQNKARHEQVFDLVFSDPSKIREFVQDASEKEIEENFSLEFLLSFGKAEQKNILAILSSLGKETKRPALESHSQYLKLGLERKSASEFRARHSETEKSTPGEERTSLFESVYGLIESALSRGDSLEVFDLICELDPQYEKVIEAKSYELVSLLEIKDKEVSSILGRLISKPLENEGAQCVLVEMEAQLDPEVLSAAVKKLSDNPTHANGLVNLHLFLEEKGVGGVIADALKDRIQRSTELRTLLEKFLFRENLLSEISSMELPGIKSMHSQLSDPNEFPSSIRMELSCAAVDRSIELGDPFMAIQLICNNALKDDYSDPIEFQRAHEPLLKKAAALLASSLTKQDEERLSRYLESFGDVRAGSSALKEAYGNLISRTIVEYKGMSNKDNERGRSCLKVLFRSLPDLMACNRHREITEIASLKSKKEQKEFVESLEPSFCEELYAAQKRYCYFSQLLELKIPREKLPALYGRIAGEFEDSESLNLMLLHCKKVGNLPGCIKGEILEGALEDLIKRDVTVYDLQNFINFWMPREEVIPRFPRLISMSFKENKWDVIPFLHEHMWLTSSFLEKREVDFNEIFKASWEACETAEKYDTAFNILEWSDSSSLKKALLMKCFEKKQWETFWKCAESYHLFLDEITPEEEKVFEFMVEKLKSEKKYKSAIPWCFLSKPSFRKQALLEIFEKTSDPKKRGSNAFHFCMAHDAVLVAYAGFIIREYCSPVEALEFYFYSLDKNGSEDEAKAKAKVEGTGEEERQWEITYDIVFEKMIANMIKNGDNFFNYKDRFEMACDVLSQTSMINRASFAEIFLNLLQKHKNPELISSFLSKYQDILP